MVTLRDVMRHNNAFLPSLQVITLFPDLTLAVEEGEPELAHDFFATVKVGADFPFLIVCFQIFDKLYIDIIPPYSFLYIYLAYKMY